jgi:hypothetical protein
LIGVYLRPQFFTPAHDLEGRRLHSYISHCT